MYYECMKWKRKWFWGFWHKNRWNHCCDWKDMVKRSFRDLFVISGKCLGWLWKIEDYGLVGIKTGSFLQNDHDFQETRFIFVKKILVDSVHRSWTTMAFDPWWTEDKGHDGGLREHLLVVDSSHGRPSQDGENEEGASGIRFWRS
jgi:hypothetical protein